MPNQDFDFKKLVDLSVGVRGVHTKAFRTAVCLAEDAFL